MKQAESNTGKSSMRQQQSGIECEFMGLKYWRKQACEIGLMAVESVSVLTDCPSYGRADGDSQCPVTIWLCGLYDSFVE